MVGLALVAVAGHTQTERRPASSPDVRVLTLESAVFGNARSIRVYLPPGHDAGGAAYPALYLNDGFAVFSERAWDAPRQLDALVRAGTIPPMILVGIDNAASIPGSRTPGLDRANEYLPWPDASEPEVTAPRGREYPRFLFDEVMPLVERSFRIDRARVGLGGASYGALAALHAANMAPRPIACLLLESPPLFMFGERLSQGAADAAWPRALYLGIGTRETDDPEIEARGTAAIDRFVAVARGAGVRVSLERVVGATHGSAAWRGRFPSALVALHGTRDGAR
jgi:predicted alpha/beta superfamily hydrolase